MKIKDENNKIKNRLIKIIKAVLLVSMLVLTYFISEKLVNYLLSLDIEILKRGLNIILVTIIMFVYTRK